MVARPLPSHQPGQEADEPLALGPESSAASRTRVSLDLREDAERAADDAATEEFKEREQVTRQLSDRDLHRQWLVYECYVRFKTERVISEELNISRETIRKYVRRERERRAEYYAATREETTQHHIDLLTHVVAEHVKYMENPLLRKGNEGIVILKASERLMQLRGAGPATVKTNGSATADEASDDAMLANLPDDLFSELVQAFADRRKADVDDVMRNVTPRPAIGVPHA